MCPRACGVCSTLPRHLEFILVVITTVFLAHMPWAHVSNISTRGTHSPPHHQVDPHSAMGVRARLGGREC